MLTSMTYEEIDLFGQDNFTQRRTTGNNLYDPESLLTGAEVEAGLGYQDKRMWPSTQVFLEAVAGKFPPEMIPGIAPRVRQITEGNFEDDGYNS